MYIDHKKYIQVSSKLALRKKDATTLQEETETLE